MQTDLATDVSGAKEGKVIGPRDGQVLLPPSLHHHAHVEAQDEGNWNQVSEVVAVEGEMLEDPVRQREGKTVRQRRVCCCHHLFTWVYSVSNDGDAILVIRPVL